MSLISRLWEQGAVERSTAKYQRLAEARPGANEERPFPTYVGNGLLLPIAAEPLPVDAAGSNRVYRPLLITICAITPEAIAAST